MDSDHVAIAYQRHISGGVITPTPSFFTVLNPHTGSVALPPVQFEASFGIPRILKKSATDVFIVYRTQTAHRFITANTLTGVLSAPVTYGAAAISDFSVSPALLGDNAVFLPYWSSDDPFKASFVVREIGGASLIAETIFHSGVTNNISAVSSGCRVLFMYQDITSLPSRGVFQVLDFSDICTPPPCPTDITDRVELFRSRFWIFLLSPLRLQLVLVHNRTSEPIPGPVALVIDDLQHATALTRATTACLSPNAVPFVWLHLGADDVLMPDETGGVFLLFLKTSSSAIMYTPRVLGGIPTR